MRVQRESLHLSLTGLPRLTGERASERARLGFSACVRALERLAKASLSLAALAQARPSLLRGPSSGLSPRMKLLLRASSSGLTPASARYRERERALVNHPHPRDEGARTVGLCASTLGGPATTGRHGTRRPQAREGPPAVSVKTRHFASRPPPPAIPVFPLPTRAGSRPGSRPSMRPHSLEVLNHWARARTRPPLSRVARALGSRPSHEAPLERGSSFRARALSSRPPLSLEKLELSGSRPSHEAPLERGSSFRARALSSRPPPRSTRESSLPRPYRPFLRRTRVAAGAPIPHARADARERVNRSTGDLHIDGKTNLPVV